MQQKLFSFWSQIDEQVETNQELEPLQCPQKKTFSTMLVATALVAVAAYMPFVLGVATNPAFDMTGANTNANVGEFTGLSTTSLLADERVDATLTALVSHFNTQESTSSASTLQLA